MTISNVTKLGQIQTASGLIENLPHNCQIARVFPFMGIDGYGITYARENTITVSYGVTSTDPAQFLGDADVLIAEHTDSPEATSPTYMLGELATRYVIPYSQQDRYQTPNDLVKTLQRVAEKRLVYRYFANIGETGAANPTDGEFEGLPALCVGSKKLNLASAALLSRHLDEMYYAVTDGPGRPNVIMSHSRALRTVLELAMAATKTWPLEYVEVEMSDPIRGKAMVRVPSWRGTPWLVNDLLQVSGSGAAARTPIFFMLLGDSEMPGAGRGVTGIIPKSRVGDMFVHRPANDASAKPHINMDCTWPVGLALGSQGALSMIEDFPLVANGA